MTTIHENVPLSGKVPDIVRMVQAVNPTRNHASLHRRLLKLMEELGEVAEAYLNVTSSVNGKGKTWDDVREELADVLIVAIDLNLTPMPDQEDADFITIEGQLVEQGVVKLEKWTNSADRSAD